MKPPGPVIDRSGSTEAEQPTLAAADFEFDVAVSFLRSDLDLALELRGRLEPQLRAFVYSREQESVAATDGLESFREVFRERARISVVLFRKNWGNTPWTGVEEIAIKDRCLATKYRSLVLVALDDTESPQWVPDGYIHFDHKTYPVEQLVGVIKARAQTLGAKLRESSLAEQAVAIKRQRAFDDVRPDVSALGFAGAGGQNPVRSVIGVEVRCRQDMLGQGLHQGTEQQAARRNPLHERRTTQLQAHMGENLTLPIEGQMERVLPRENQRQERGAGKTLLDRGVTAPEPVRWPSTSCSASSGGCAG